MKKILNWTFGGFFRALGRILCFLVVGGLIAYLIASNDFKLPDILSFGIMRVNAATITPTYKKYRVRYYSLATGDNALTSVTEMGTATQFSNDYGVEMVSARFGVTTKFQAGTTYRVTLDVGFGGLENEFLYLDDFACFGSSTINSWDAQQSYISTCDYVGSSINNNNRINYVFNITPQANVEGIQFNLYYGITEEVLAVNVRPTSTITYGEDPTGAINEQTIIIEQEFENITNVIEQNNQNLINSITEQNQVCDLYDKNSIALNNKYLNTSGIEMGDSNFGITDYIKITDKGKVNVLNPRGTGDNASYCFYNINKTLISCQKTNTLINPVTIPTNTSYVRVSINKNQNLPQFEVCINGNQALTDELHGLGKGIHDNNTSEATSEASDFFNNFSTNTHGLTSIVTAPLNAITSLSSSTCSPLHLPIPYLDNKFIDLPCMRTIYDTNFGSFMNLYDTIIFGIVSYWIIVRIFALVKDFKNPEHDEIEVVDL